MHRGAKKQRKKKKTERRKTLKNEKKEKRKKQTNRESKITTPLGLPFQFVIFKLLSYCFEETMGFNLKASFASRPVSRLIR